MSAAREPRWHLPLLALLGLPVFFWGLADYSVVNGDEGFYHSAAVLMAETGDWFRVEYFGQHRVYDTFMNAPLQYWARAALITLFGDNLWTMRLLSAAFGLLTVLAVHRLAAALDPSPRKWAALAAGLVQLTTFQFVYLHGARTGELDAIVCFLMTAAALTFLHGVRDRWSFVPHHLALAALLSVKLPLVAVPVLAELALFAVLPSARARFRSWLWTGLAIVPLVLTWHAFQAAFLWEDFVEVATKMTGEASGRVGGGANTGSPAENLSWYAGRLFAGAFPWSIAFVPAVLAALGRTVLDPRERAHRDLRVPLLFALVVLAFFTLVSKRFSWYVLPATPFLAVLTGLWFFGGTRLRHWAGGLTVGAVASFALWLTVPIEGVRPLVVRTPRFPLEVAWREVERLPTVTGFWLVLGLVGLGAVLAIRAWRERASAIVGGSLFAALLALAAVRVAVPLGSLEHVSDLERLHASVEARRVAGEAIDFPLALPESTGWLKVVHYFGRNYSLAKNERTNQILITGVKRTPPPETP